MRVHRVEVWPASGEPDPQAEDARRHAADHAALPPLQRVRTARVYLIEAALQPDELARIAEKLLADPIAQRAVVGQELRDSDTVEVHFLPGVMDPVASSTQEAIREMLPRFEGEPLTVRTGVRFDFEFASGAVSEDTLRAFAAGSLGNPVVQAIHVGPFHPERFPHGQRYKFNLRRVPTA